ncbi:MAG TPA: NAD-dependent epimerase/dehydratase family protein [Anaerolineae bacterium]|jgi:CDP-paratose 2-epimerase|nr:NAD-dependent epimerase/dehydratase family protein [Anaerolineae bacterium]
MKMFITGGAGFVGCNCADHFLGQGHEVVIYDNLSRAGGPANLAWLQGRHDRRLRFIQGDVRDAKLLATSMQGAEAVLHLASQVAVTTSVENPREDFEINAWGTFNVLEAVRHQAPEAAFLYASSNKVYGGMESVKVVDEGGRYAFADFVQGIPENFPLDFHSPYGCSKGAGDQYTIDYARIYGLRTVSLRQSCIYGRRQFGVEDQGWVAHFVIAAALGRPITIYGDGRQVRDLLHVSDLVQAYELCIRHIDRLKGQALNLGGGPDNTITIWSEFGPLLAALLGRQVEVRFDDWRPGDQKVFVANIARAANWLGWRPTVTPAAGIGDLYEWVRANPELFAARPGR